MKKLIIAALAVTALAACTEDPEIDAPTVGVTNANIPGNFYEVEIDGKPCLLWKGGNDIGSQEGITYSGITCDWNPR